MQGELTPVKPSNPEHEYYSAEFTSGKQRRRVKLDVFCANRDEFIVNRRFYPFVNIMADQSATPHHQNPEAIEDFTQEIEETGKNCMVKQQQMQQLQRASPSAHQRVIELMAQLKEQKFERERRKHELMSLKKANLKASRKLELLKDRTLSQVHEMRIMTKQHEQCMYQMNRYIYDQEKEKQRLMEEAVALAAQERAIKENIRVREGVWQEQLREEAQIDADYKEKSARYDEISACLGEQILQVTVLKMQINPYMRVSFEALNNSQSCKKKILEKNPNLWQKRNKILMKEEVKYFILIQLYPNWRRLLDRLSYHFVGYKQLLFQQCNQQLSGVLEDLGDYIFSSGLKKSAAKFKNHIVLFSPRAEAEIKLKETLIELVGLNNGIIEVFDITFEKAENQSIEEVKISYSFKGEKKVKEIEMVYLKELTREALLPFIPPNHKKSDKSSLIKIEIPFYFDSPSDRMRMEDAYRLIEREK